jgi:glutamate--cysteine ligase
MSLDRPAEREQPVESAKELISYFRSKERPPSEWKVGIEHEKIGIVAGTLEPAPYSGPAGISAILRGFERFGYTSLEEEGNVIASEHEGLTVSIEPGAQLELSGRPFKNVHVVAAELDRHLDKCRELGQELGLEFLATGYRPWGTPEGSPWCPKVRYRIMRPFLAARGRHALDMMAMTGSTQASFDFSSEQDMGAKLRVALAVQPAMTALFANSPIVNGRESGWKSFRVEVWNHVDPARCGLMAFPFEPGFDDDAYRRYVDWALAVPMVFLRRGDRYIDPDGRTFRAFLAEGLAGERALLSDWEDHLTTLFPEARVKNVVEVRAADAVDPRMVKGLAAFWKGILYDREARSAAWSLVKRFDLAQRRELMNAAGREGLAALLPDGRRLSELASDLIEIATEGLGRQKCCCEQGWDERIWLEPLSERAASGRSPADDALEAFRRGGGRALAEHLRVV